MKDLPEMTDRDWRIFKEDFNIAAKGSLKVNFSNPYLKKKKKEVEFCRDLLSTFFFKSYMPIKFKR